MTRRHERERLERLERMGRRACKIVARSLVATFPLSRAGRLVVQPFSPVLIFNSVVDLFASTPLVISLIHLSPTPSLSLAPLL